MAWERDTPESDAIAGDRRQIVAIRSTSIQMEADPPMPVLETNGHCIDFSSWGLLFDAGRALPEGLNVELSVTWPVLLHNIAPMQLVVYGRIKRVRGRLIAIQTVQHEFRTAGISTEQRSGGGGATPTRNPTLLSSPAVLGALGKR
jgi:hypothetical protein